MVQVPVNLDETYQKWYKVGLLAGIENLSEQIVLSLFFECELLYLMSLPKTGNADLDNEETFFFPILRRLFTSKKLSPKYFLPQYDVENFETYDFFITLKSNIEDRILYELEIGNYIDKNVNTTHRTTVVFDLCHSIKTFIPVLAVNFREYLLYMKSDLDTMIMINSLPDPESELISSYCDNFKIENLLKRWNERKSEPVLTVEDILKHINSSLNNIDPTVNT